MADQCLPGVGVVSGGSEGKEKALKEDGYVHSRGDGFMGVYVCRSSSKCTL